MPRWEPEGYSANAKSVVDIYTSGWSTPFEQIITLAKHSRILEVGCGGGKWSAFFALNGCDATILDNNPEMLLKVLDNYPYIKFRAIQDDAVTMEKVQNRAYHLVFSEGTVEHFLDKGIRKKVIYNMLRKSCQILMYLVPLESKEADEHCYKGKAELLEEFNEVLYESNCFAMPERIKVYVEEFIVKNVDGTIKLKEGIVIAVVSDGY